MKKIKIKEWEDLTNERNYKYIIEVEKGQDEKAEWICARESPTSRSVDICIKTTEKEQILAILKVLGFDVEFIKPLTDDERLAEIQCLMTELGMTELSERQKEIMQKVFDLTNDNGESYYCIGDDAPICEGCFDSCAERCLI
jgi:hypothetical protein